MKKLIISFMLCGIMTVFVSCTSCKPFSKPANLKPLSKTEYNDVYTVYYNCSQNCKSDFNPYERDTIKVCGWIASGCSDLVDDSERNCVSLFSKIPFLTLRLPSGYWHTDNSNKCFITGIIRNHWEGGMPRSELIIDVLNYYFNNE